MLGSSIMNSLIWSLLLKYTHDDDDDDDDNHDDDNSL